MSKNARFAHDMVNFESDVGRKRFSAHVAMKRVNVKSRLIKLVLLPLWYGNKDIIRDTLS